MSEFYSNFYNKVYSNQPSWAFYDHEKAYEEFINTVFFNGSGYKQRIPKIDHIQVNGDITTVIWKDGTHTIVTKAADDEFDIQTAIVYAIVKKITGNTSGSLNRYMNSLSDKIVIKNKKPSSFMETLRTILPYLKTDGKKVNDEEETFFEE